MVKMYKYLIIEATKYLLNTDVQVVIVLQVYLVN